MRAYSSGSGAGSTVSLLGKMAFLRMGREAGMPLAIDVRINRIDVKLVCGLCVCVYQWREYDGHSDGHRHRIDAADVPAGLEGLRVQDRNERCDGR